MTDLEIQSMKEKETKQVTREAKDARERLRSDLEELDKAVQRLKVTAIEITGAAPPPRQGIRWPWTR